MKTANVLQILMIILLKFIRAVYWRSNKI